MPETVPLIRILPEALAAPFRRQVYLGILATSLAGVFHPLAGMGALGVFLAINQSPIQRHFREASNGILILFIALFLFSPSFLVLVLFTIYFQAVYYWGARKLQHFLWITAVGFVHLAVVATIMSSVLFPLVFIGYVVVLTQALLAANFLGGITDEAGIPERRELGRWERRIGRRIRGIGYWIAGTSLLIAMIFFPVLPRIQALSYQPTQLSQESVSGFADEVTLGEIGAIHSDNRVALRIVFSSKELARRVWRWRGATLENWKSESQKWTASDKRDYLEILGGREIAFYSGEGGPSTAQGLEMRVNVSSMGDPRVFLPEMDGRMPWQTHSIRGEFPEILFDPNGWTCQPRGDLRFRGFEYHVTLMDDDERERFMPPRDQLDPETEEHCLSLGALPEGLRDQISRRAEELVPGFQTGSLAPEFVAQRINAGLQSSQPYTMDFSSARSAKNLGDFITEKKAGNCEYFATAMALMLRLHGIPSRLVTGFQPGRENLVASYQMIRQSDAHSWVEAFHPGRGWVTYDPTPSARTPPGWLVENLALALDAYDYLQLQWNQYILDFTQSDQKDLFASFMRSSHLVLEPIFITGEILIAARRVIAAILFVVFLIWLCREMAPDLGPLFQSWSLRLPAFSWLAWRRKSDHLATRFFLRLEKEWAKRGISRSPGETPATYLLRVIERFPGAAPRVEEFSTLYHTARFGPFLTDSNWIRAVRSVSADILADLRKSPK